MRGVCGRGGGQPVEKSYLGWDCRMDLSFSRCGLFGKGFLGIHIFGFQEFEFFFRLFALWCLLYWLIRKNDQKAFKVSLSLY